MPDTLPAPRERRIARSLAVVNGLLALPALPVGLALGVLALVPNNGGAGPAVQVVTGGALLWAVGVGTFLLWGYVRVAWGRAAPLGAPRFWGVSAGHNALLLLFDGWMVRDLGTASSTLVLLLAAWHGGVLALSLRARHHAGRAASHRHNAILIT